MNALADFHFIRPLAWLAIVPVLGLWWWTRHRTDPLRGWREQIDPELLRALIVGRGARARGGVGLLAGVLGVIAIAGPTWRLEPSPFADDAAPLVILLQLDASDRDPVEDAARLARARLEIADIAAERAGQPLGLIAYAGSAHLVLPPTRDTAIVAQMAAELDPSIMPRAGDRLDGALALGARLLAGSDGSLLMIGDRVRTDPALLPAPGTLPPLQFLAPDAEEPSLDAAAARLDAVIEAYTVDREDSRAIVYRASRTALARKGESARWEESGYWLVPLLVLLQLHSFRRRQVAVAERPA